MASRRARVDGLNDDLSALSEKVEQLYDDLEAVVEEMAAEAEAAAEAEGSASTATRTDGGHVGWEEIETVGPDGDRDAETVEWTTIETQ